MKGSGNMKIEKEKLGKILKSKKAIRKIMVACVMCAVAFYGIAFMLGNFGIIIGKDILMQWGNIFVVIVILIIIYEMFVLDEDFQQKLKSKKKIKEKVEKWPKCKGSDYVVLRKPLAIDNNPIEKRQCQCGYIYDVPVEKEVATGEKDSTNWCRFHHPQHCPDENIRMA